MEEFNELAKKYFSHAESKTVSNYKSCLRKLLNHTNKGLKESFNDLDSIKYLAYENKNAKGEYNPSTAITYINVILSTLKKIRVDDPSYCSNEHYIEVEKIFKDLREKKKVKADQLLPTTSNTYEDCKELLSLWDPSTLEYLYLQCNLLIAPRRRDDWEYAVFVEKLPDNIDETINYIVIGGKYVEFYFNKYKKSVKRTLGVWQRELCNDNFIYNKYFDIFNQEKLGEILKKSYESNPRFYVFGKKTTNMFKAFIKKTFAVYHKHFVQTNIRHIMVDKLLKDSPYTTATLRRAFAFDMGQTSLETQLMYSSKDDSDDESDDICIEDESDISSLSGVDISALQNTVLKEVISVPIKQESVVSNTLEDKIINIHKKIMENESTIIKCNEENNELRLFLKIINKY
jgi:hypothetical protein